MPLPLPLLTTEFPGLTLHRRGKVRDVYDLGDALLIVATDRISAFDHVLGSGIPDKGRVLTQLSVFWFNHLQRVVPHHLLSIDVDEYPSSTRPYREALAGRSMMVRRTRPVPLECVARGYLAGSAWKEYRRNGAVCGLPLRRGLSEAERLPAPIFTPSTKAEQGHDENLSEPEAARLIGDERLARLRDLTLEIYREGAAHAASHGIIVADTKLEFGVDDHGEIVLIDEVLTPDSSRFWPMDEYRTGGSPPSFDKQFVRDYLDRIGWNRQPPVPTLPDDVIERTREKYLEALTRLTDQPLR